MADTLRNLLIQRAARLQDRLALACPPAPSLGYAQLRNRVEGVALGLMAEAPPPGTAVYSLGPGPWGWFAELAAACCGLRWEPGGRPVDPELLGGRRFNDEAGRQAYHDREGALGPDTPFLPGLSQDECLLRLQRLNRRLGWDHRSSLELPEAVLGGAEGRAALWSALYAGAAVRIHSGASWAPTPFQGLLEP